MNSREEKMRKAILLLLVMGLFPMAGCGAAPKTPTEFRQSVSAGMMGYQHESFKVNRSFKEIGKTFEKMSNKCLDVRVVRTVTINPRDGAGSSDSYYQYKPTVNISNDSAELYVQVQISGKVLKLQAEPDGGYFVLLTDVTPVNKGSSDVKVFYAPAHAKEMLASVKGWATGEDLSCPDVAQSLSSKR
jgi:hypothetical protein